MAPGKKRGQKGKLTEEVVADAIRYKRRGAPDCDICDALGIHPATFYRWIQDGGSTRLGRELSEGLKNAEADYKTSLRAEIERQGRERDWKALAWILERRFPAEYSRVDRVQAEVQQQTTASVTVEHFFDYGDDDDGGEDDE